MQSAASAAIGDTGEGMRQGAASGAEAEGGKALTQARILRAAMQRFAAEGYERTTIAAIAEDAGVSRATVFWHFSDKANLFAEATRALLTPFVQELEKNAAELEDPRQRLLELFLVYEEFVEKNRETIETFVRWVLESPALREPLQRQLFALHDQFARDVGQALTRSLGDESEAAALSAALMALLDGTLLLSFLDTDPRARQLRQRGLRTIAGLLLTREAGD